MTSKVKALLRNEKPAVIREDAKLAPYWIARIFYDTLKENQVKNEMA